jgi:hypothetical protein
MALLVTTAALVMTLDGTTGKVWKSAGFCFSDLASPSLLFPLPAQINGILMQFALCGELSTTNGSA